MRQRVNVILLLSHDFFIQFETKITRFYRTRSIPILGHSSYNNDKIMFQAAVMSAASIVCEAMITMANAVLIDQIRNFFIEKCL